MILMRLKDAFMLAPLLALACSSGSGKTAGPTTPPSHGPWVGSGDDVQDTKPWGSAGPGIGAPAPGTYVGTNPAYDPGCYRYYAASGTGDGTSAATPAGNAIEAINAICKSESERANVKGKKLCLKRGDEFRGAFDGMSHALLTLSFCADVSIEDFGDQRLPRPRILGSRVAPSTWTAAADPRIRRLDLSTFLLPGYTWTHNGQSHTDEERVEQVFVDGKKLLLARHPNFGEGKTAPTFDPRREKTATSMLFIEESFPERRAFRDSKLPTTSPLQSPVDWTGANLHYKHATWITDGSTVTAYDAAQHELTTTSRVAEASEVYKGYFINNHVAALDQAGEWYYDAKARTLYLWPPENVDLTTARVDLSFARANTPAYGWDSTPAPRRGMNAFTLSYASGITLKNLEVRHFSARGLFVGAPGTVIQDCHFEGFSETGLGLGYNIEEALKWNQGSAPSRVENTWIENAGCNGILADMPDFVAANNTLINIGSLEQYGPHGQGLDAEGCDLTYHETGFGIMMGGQPRQTARYNFLERIGHNGVGFHGPDSVVEGNVIHLASVTKGDSGGVKCWAWNDQLSAEANFARPGVTGSVVSKNIVVETIGTAEGVTFPGAALGDGFFIDFGCQGTTFTDNVAARNTSQGFLLTIDRNQTLEGNTAFANSMEGGTQIAFGDCQLASCPYTLRNNIMVSTTALEQSFSVAPLGGLTAEGNTYLDPFAVPAANFDFDPWQRAVCSMSDWRNTSATCFTLPTWRTATGGDSTAKDAGFFWRDEYPSDYLSGDLVANPGFDDATSPWEGYLGTTTWDSGSAMGPSLRLDRTGETGSYQGNAPVTKGASYEVRARVLGVNPVEPWLSLETMTHEWTRLTEQIPLGKDAFPVSNQPRESGVIFKAIVDDATGYLRLTTRASRVWIDDLHVRQVETYKVPRGVVLRPGDAIPTAARMVLFINPSTSAQTASLFDDAMIDLDGKPVSGSVALPALGSRVLVAGAKLGLGKATRDLGMVPAGTVARQTPVLASIGARPLSITSVRIKETGTPFSVTTACDGRTLEPSGLCAVELTYSPAAAGDHVATLVVTSNDGQGAERAIALKGRAE